MKVILYLAQTVNGFIAKEDDSAPWSQDAWDNYQKIVEKAGNMIVGRKTYEIMQEAGDLNKMPEIRVCVVSGSAGEDSRGIHFVSSPKEAIEYLKDADFKIILIGGGSKMATSFLEQELVDEIWLDVESQIFGKGIPFVFGNLELQLKLRKAKKMSKNLLHLQYKVR